MTDKEAIEYIEELMEYNRNGLLLTPQNNGFDTFYQCSFEHAVRALENKFLLEKIADFVINNWHTCPIPEDNFKCLSGFKKEGCRECFIKYINALN